MHIKMKETMKGAHDGVTIHEYVKGKVYPHEDGPPLSEDLRRAFLEGKHAVEHDPDEPESDDDESKDEDEDEKDEEEDEKDEEETQKQSRRKGR